MIFGGGALLIGLMLVQIFYPSDKLLPFAKVDGLDVGGQSRSQTVDQLDKAYDELTTPLFLEGTDTAYREPLLSEIGASADNHDRIAKATYDWYLRIIPTSLFWAHAVKGMGEPAYSYNSETLAQYVSAEFQDCRQEPREATILTTDGTLKIDSGSSGATCEADEVSAELATATPTLDQPAIILPATEIPQTVFEDDVHDSYEELNDKLSGDVPLKLSDEEKVKIPNETVIGWLDFAVTDGQFGYYLNAERAAPYLAESVAPKVKVEVGVTTVTLEDYFEKSRDEGVKGNDLDNATTLVSIEEYLHGNVDTATVGIIVTEPAVVYVRTYSPDDSALATLMKNFAESHSGTYGVSLVELGDRHRHASYRGTTQYTPASTYKLFVAYSTLLRVESGEFLWTDQVSGGRNLAKCFDDMIVLSDNACAVALLTRIGRSTVTAEAHAIGATSTFFRSDGIISTPKDESMLLSLLHTGQILSQQASRDRLTDAMKRNVYRTGIPAGVPGIVVADKVGFLDALLHDASIVYAPHGTYVLIIMTENSSWATIAAFAKEIEAYMAK